MSITLAAPPKRAQRKLERLRPLQRGHVADAGQDDATYSPNGVDERLGGPDGARIALSVDD